MIDAHAHFGVVTSSKSTGIVGDRYVEIDSPNVTRVGFSRPIV